MYDKHVSKHVSTDSGPQVSNGETTDEDILDLLQIFELHEANQVQTICYDRPDA